MITEDYVSYETAKLLKKSGFDSNEISCINVFKGHTYKIQDTVIDADEDVTIPTIQLAMKWLREVHHLFIAIHPRLSFTDYYWITADIYRVKRKSSLYHAEDVDDYHCIACCDETSFENAGRTAIKYCLENLI